MELIRGCHNKNELQKLHQRLKHYHRLAYNEDVSSLAEQFMFKYKLSHNLTIPDAIIGASAIVNKIPLFTYNLKDFQFMHGIKLYSIH